MEYNDFTNKLALIIIMVCILKPEIVNGYYLKYTKCLGIKTKHPEKSSDKQVDYLPIILFSIPILYLMFNDYTLGGDKWEENFLLINIDKYISKRLYNYILRIAGAYGLIQVLAQDIGIKTGLNQRNFSQSSIVQFLILYGGAYSFTGFRGEAMLATFLYLVLKYNSSLNQVSDVCFESV
tara:strand:- start:607 stop:1146 length:540 start_codon:yes stop_codon:yes gene_type:complete